MFLLLKGTALRFIINATHPTTHSLTKPLRESVSQLGLPYFYFSYSALSEEILHSLVFDCNKLSLHFPWLGCRQCGPRGYTGSRAGSLAPSSVKLSSEQSLPQHFGVLRFLHIARVAGTRPVV